MPDHQQKTGLQVRLPESDFDYCNIASTPSVCSDPGTIDLLNHLDGFSVNPRIMVCFSTGIDVNTLSSGISILPVSRHGAPIAINQIFYAQTRKRNCAFAKPNQVLNQQSSYLLLVTDAVHDAGGKSVGPDPAYTACINNAPDDYCAGLSHALAQAHLKGHIVTASLFTTLSATTWLEQARQFVNGFHPLAVPAGLPFTFTLSDVRNITWSPQGSGLPPQPIPLAALSGVKSIAFGLYLSPNFLDPTNGTIAPTPTNTPIGGPVPTPTALLGYALVSFHVFLPATPRPTGGFPVVIYGHGLGDNQFGAPTFIAGTLAKHGFATLAMEIQGNGYGPGSTVQVTDNFGIPHTVSTPGRGIVLPGNSQIGPTDGCIAPGAVAIRDCGRQTAVDLFALVKTIQQTHGLGMNLDPKRIYYVGQSFGSNYGTLVQAVEPGISAAVLNGDGGTLVDVARLSITGRVLANAYLKSVNPLLLNSDQSQGRYFNDNYVFRDRPPLVNDITEAPAIQAAFEAADWLDISGDPLAYALHLKTSPLAGVPAKNTLFQFGYGDLEMPNPTESAVIRAANAQSSSWFLHFDEALASHPELLAVESVQAPFPILPHRVLSNETIFDTLPSGELAYPAETSLALAEQEQVAAYFASNGKHNANPNRFLTGTFQPSSNLFEAPTTLPESPNFLILFP